MSSNGVSNKNVAMWKPTGLRVPLVLAQSIPASSAALVTQNPQMDFRGENLICDTVVVGPNCTITVPTVGTTPQVAGGPAGTGVPGTMFSPTQSSPMDFQMMISNQGNAVQITVTNTITTSALAFASLLFGQEVEVDHQALAAAAAGMAPAGAFRHAAGGMAPAGAFAGFRRNAR
jgi:hypothetical protein